jgi:alpha-tubulin suppressor-like RCC1 family protein
MNRFWGRNDTNDSKYRKFSRDNEQILSLNYENLCDGDYLNRIFVDDNGSSGSGGNGSYSNGGNGTSTGEKGSSTFAAASESWELTPDIAEDVILFGDDENLGRDFLNRRWKSDVVSLNKYQDSLATLIHKQVDVFEHVAKIIVEKATVSEQEANSRLVVKKQTETITIVMPGFVSDSLQCSLQIVERHSRRGWRASNMEPVIQLLTNSFSTKPSASPVPADKSKHPMVSPKNAMSQFSIDLLRAALCNGFLQTARPQEQVTCQQRENSLRVSLTAAYGILMLGVHTNSVEDVLLAVTHLLLLSIQMEEWKSITDTSNIDTVYNSAINAASGETLSIQDSTKKQRLAKIKNSETGAITKVGPQNSKASGSNNNAANNTNHNANSKSKFESPAIMSIADDLSHRELSYEESLFHSNGATNSTPNGNAATGISWERKSQTTTIAINSKLSSIEKERDRDNNKAKFSLVKPKTPVTAPSGGKQPASGGNNTNGMAINFVEETTGPINISKSTSKSVTLQHTVHAAPVPGLQKEKEKESIVVGNQTIPVPIPVPVRGQSRGISVGTSNGALAENSNQTLMKGLMFVPKSLVTSLFEMLSSHSASPMATSSSGGKRYSGILSKSTPSQATAASTAILGSVISTARGGNSSFSVQRPHKTASTYVWSCGQNSYGELGLGDVNQRRSFNRVSYFDNKGVVSVGAGNEHSLFVTKDGKLVVAGYNDNGQCGTGTTQQVRQLTPLQSLDGEEIVSVHVNNGCEHTLAITKDGKLYSFGYNYRGQLGHGTICSESTPRPIKNLMSKKVIFAASSYHHSIVCCSDGTMFSFGRNDCGQLGQGDLADRKSPQLITAVPKEVIGMSCGQFHSIIVTAGGEALVCGKNDYGQLGFESPDNVKSFTKIKLPVQMSPHKLNSTSSTFMNDSVRQVCCGYYHTLLLLHNGTVLGVGRNDYGQLGLGHSQAKINSCQVIHGLSDKSVTTITAGCYHSVAATSNGMLYMFGRNNHGQLGSGDVDEHHVPHPVDNFVGKSILSIAAGFYHTLVLTSESLIDPIPEKEVVARAPGTSSASVTISELLMNSTSSLPLLDLLDKALTPTHSSAPMSILHPNASTRTPTPNTTGITTGKLSRGGSENNSTSRPSFTSAAHGVINGLATTSGEDTSISKSTSAKGIVRVSFKSNGGNEIDVVASGGSALPADSEIGANGVLSQEGDGTAAQANSSGKSSNSDGSNMKPALPANVFTLNSRSKLPLPELWRSLIVQLNEMMDGTNSANVSSSKTGVFDWKMVSVKELKLNFAWIVRVLRSCDVLLEVALAEMMLMIQTNTVGIALEGTALNAIGYASISTFLKQMSAMSSPPSQNLRFMSSFTSLQLTKTIIRVIDSLFHRYGDFLSSLLRLEDLSGNGPSTRLETYTEFLNNIRNRNVNELIEEIHLQPSSIFESSLQGDRFTAGESVLLRDIFASDNQDIVAFSLSKLRNKLLFVSLHIGSSPDGKDSINSKFRETYDEIVSLSSNIICTQFDTLYPLLQQRCQLISLLGSVVTQRSPDELEESELNRVFPIQHDRCLRLFTKLCFKYRDLNEVMELFKVSKYSGLLVFRDILSAYNKLSMINIGAQQQNAVLGVGDIFRSVGTLEYCCSNFVKCALPIIFEEYSYSCSGESVTCLQEGSKPTSQDISSLGMQIIRDVCQTSEFVLDVLCQQQNLDPGTGIGSVIPSILPTILLYAIHYAATKPIAVEFLPIVQSLTKSLYSYVINASAQQSTAVPVSAPADLTPSNSVKVLGTSVSTKRFGLDSYTKKQSARTGGERTTNSDVAGTDSLPFPLMTGVVSGMFADSSKSVDESFWKKEPLQLSWCSRLLKICTILSAKLASSYICDVKYRQNKLALLSSKSSLGNVSSASIRKCLQFDKHSLWQFLSGPNLSVEWQALYDFDAAPSLEELLGVPGKQSTQSIPTRIITTTAALRMRQFKTDPMYKQLFNPAKSNNSTSSGASAVAKTGVQSSASSLAANYQCIEAILMDCVMHVVGYDTLDLWMNYMDTKTSGKQDAPDSGSTSLGTARIAAPIARGTSQLKLIWGAVAGFSKSLLRNRSKLMASAVNTASWNDVVNVLTMVCSCMRSMVLMCIPSVESNNPLLSTPVTMLVTYSRAKRALRRAVLVILCCKRWQAATSVKASSVGLVVVSFFNSIVECVTDSFSDSNKSNAQARWGLIVSSLNYAAEDASRLCLGLNLFIALLQDTPIPSMRCDVLSELSRAWKLRTELEASTGSLALQGNSREIMRFCDLNTVLDTKLAVSLLLTKMTAIGKEFYSNYKSNLSSAATGEIVLLTISLKFLRQFCAQNSSIGSVASTSFASFAHEISGYGWMNYLSDLKVLFLLLDEKSSDSMTQSILQDDQQQGQSPAAHGQAKPTASILSASASTTQVGGSFTNKRTHPKDRNKLLRKASGAIVYLIQEISVQITQPSKNMNWTNICNLLLSFHCELFGFVQRTRLNLNRNAVDIDSSVSGAKLPGGGTSESPPSGALGVLGLGGLVGNPAATATPSSSATNLNSPSKATPSSNKDNAAKRRCQDLIVKSMEFCRSQEGFIVQGDKLLNNYKGSTDFTLATWIYIRKNPSKQSFVTGKVSHNDAWPVLTLRPDGKLALYYGHGNDFDNLVSQAAIQCCQWTHVAVVIEGKKIKIFVNGMPDNQAHSKGNTRAILYPVIVGACPQGVRTRIEQVKEGFEGLLAQYKYYTRALSPIHIRVIFDQGPPESYDIQERWLYQLLGSCKLLLSKVCADGVDGDIPEIVSMVSSLSEVFHMLFVTDTTSRLRTAALKLFTMILKLNKLSDLKLSCQSGTLAYGGAVATNAANNTGPLSVVTCSMLDGTQSIVFQDRMVLYLIRLLGFCYSPHVLSITDDMMSETIDFISVLQQQCRNSRLQLQHSMEIDNEFILLREFFEYIPGFLTCRSAKSDESSSPAGSVPTNSNELSREDQVSELFGQLLMCLRSLSETEGWRSSMSRVVVAILAKMNETLESSQPNKTGSYSAGGAASSGLDAMASLLLGSNNSTTSKSFASRVFGRNGAWSLLASIESLGVALLLGERWSIPSVGADVSSYFSNSMGRILNVNRGNGMVTLLSWNNSGSLRQLSVVRSTDISSCRLSSVAVLDMSVVESSLVRVMTALERYAALVLSDHLSACKPDHGFQRQSLLRIFRPVEVFLFNNLLTYASQVDCAAALKASPILSNFLVQSVIQAFHVDSFEEDVDEILSESNIASLWVKSAKYNIALMGKVCTSEFPPPESERSLIDFVSRGLGVAIDSFLQTPFEHYVKQGQLSHLLFFVPLSAVTGGSGSGGDFFNALGNMHSDDGGNESSFLGDSYSSAGPSGVESNRSSKMSNNNNHEDDNDQDCTTNNSSSLFEMKLRSLLARFPLSGGSNSSNNSSAMGQSTRSSASSVASVKYPMNDWLSAAAEGNAINLFGSGQVESGHTIPAVATLKIMHIVRQEIIRSSRKLLFTSVLDESNFAALPFPTKYLLWCALSSSAFHLEQLKRQQQQQQSQTSATASTSTSTSSWASWMDKDSELNEREQAVMHMMMTHLYHHHRSEVTQALSLSLIFARNSLLQSNSSKYAGGGSNILVCSNIVTRIFDSCAVWVHFHVGKKFELQLCVEVLKILLPALSLSTNSAFANSPSSNSSQSEASTIANELELCMMQWCRNALYRIIQLASSPSGSNHTARPNKEVMELAKSCNFTLIRSRAQEQLSRQKANSSYQFNELAQQLSHLTANLEIVQRICCSPVSMAGFLPFKTALRAVLMPVSPRPASRPGLSRPTSAYTLRPSASSANYVNNTTTSSSESSAGSVTATTLSNALAASTVADDASGSITDTPIVIGLRECSVEIDLTSCALSALHYADYFLYRTSAASSATSGADGSGIMSMDEFKTSTASSRAQIIGSVEKENVMIEVAIGVEVVGEEPVYDTIYCGSSLQLLHSGLSPNCGYYMKCRASVTLPNGSASFALDWSKDITFHTEEGVPFTFDPLKCGPDIMLSDDCLTASYAGDDSWSTLLGSKSFTSGITSWRIKVTQSSTAYIFVGIASGHADLNTFLGGCSQGYGFIGEQALYHNREKVKVYGDAFGAGDVVGVILDLNVGTLSFTKNGKNLGVAFDKVFGEMFPAVAFYNVGQELEIMVDHFQTTCPHEPIPCSLSRSSVDDIGTLWEVLYCLNTASPLPHRVLHQVAEHCNQWCQSSQIRCKIASGKNIFLNKTAPTNIFDFAVGERIRSPYGVAEIVGFAYNRVWFRVDGVAESVWFFSQSQIAKGREKGYFTRCTYDEAGLNASSADSGATSSAPEVVVVVVDNVEAEYGRAMRKAAIGAASSSRLINSTSSNNEAALGVYDAASLHELLEPSRWCAELDAVLMAFLTNKGDEHSISPWWVSANLVNDEFRGLQQSLSRIVMNSVDLSHRYGIAGPKRKAVVARLGLLRYFNHLVDHYMPALLSATASSNIELYYAQLNSSNTMNGALADDYHVRVVSISTAPNGVVKVEELQPLPPPPPPIDVMIMPPKPPVGTIFMERDESKVISAVESKTVGDKAPAVVTFSGVGVLPIPAEPTSLQSLKASKSASISSSSSVSSPSQNLRHPLLSLSWERKPQHLPTTLASSRMRIFTDLKLTHFWDLLAKSVTRTSKIDDDYDYPDDLPQIKINRYKSFRAREASEMLGISGEDLLQSSMFYQLMRELRKEGPDKLRMSYTHPMDDGQSRAFKIKFDGEGVDDYGGPYREIFQQICDELQRPDPTHAVTFDVAGDMEDADGNNAYAAAAKIATTSSDSAGNPEMKRLSDTLIDGSVLDDIRPIRCFIQLLLPTPNWTIPDCDERYKYTFYPGPLSSVRTELYTFFGQLVGIALRSKITLDIMLASYIWKFVVQEPLTEKDIASFDRSGSQFVSQLGALHARMTALDQSEEGRASAETEARAYIQDQMWAIRRGDGRVVELCPGGASKPVTLEDLGAFVAAYAESRLLESYPAISAFRTGLLTVIPETAIALLTWSELEQLVCGSMSIDIRRLQDNTEYDDDISAVDPHIVMFWEVLEEFSELEKSAFLRFVWARPTLPPKGVEFPQKFKIQSAVGEDTSLKPDQYLPKAHTCFFSINLPKYSSKKVSEHINFACLFAKKRCLFLFLGAL